MNSFLETKVYKIKYQPLKKKFTTNNTNSTKSEIFIEKTTKK